MASTIVCKCLINQQQRAFTSEARSVLWVSYFRHAAGLIIMLRLRPACVRSGVCLIRARHSGEGNKQRLMGRLSATATSTNQPLITLIPGGARLPSLIPLFARCHESENESRHYNTRPPPPCTQRPDVYPPSQTTSDDLCQLGEREQGVQ